ncbi:hypothetical protein RCS94_06300 [Orbaceae bacterium ac157xtp]
MQEVYEQQNNSELEPITKVRFFLSAEQYLAMNNNNLKSFVRHMKYKFRYLIQIILGWFILSLIILAGNRTYLYVMDAAYLPEFLGYLATFSALGFFSGLILGLFRLSFFIGEMLNKKRSRFNALKVNSNTPFEYTFYKEGVVINEPYQQFEFRWSDVAEISLFKETFLIALCPSNIKGYEWTKYYSNICIPAKVIEKEKELMEFVKQLPQFKSFQELGF